MLSNRGFLAILFVTAAMSAGPGVALAETLVMPHACTMASGHPRLMPSEQREYTVYGKKEQRDFSSCSEVNPSLCRRGPIYRFDVDCGGKPVPWISVVASATAYLKGHVWDDRDRLQMEMPRR